MRTVKDLISLLEKFPLDAECYAYEGEVVGLLIEKDGSQGFIGCRDEEEIKRDESATIFINNKSKTD